MLRQFPLSRAWVASVTDNGNCGLTIRRLKLSSHRCEFSIWLRSGEWTSVESREIQFRLRVKGNTAIRPGALRGRSAEFFFFLWLSVISPPTYSKRANYCPIPGTDNFPFAVLTFRCVPQSHLPRGTNLCAAVVFLLLFFRSLHYWPRAATAVPRRQRRRLPEPSR